MRPVVRKALIVSACLIAIALAVLWDVDRRWGVESPLASWGELDVHAFGQGPTAVILLHGYGSSPDALVPLAHALAERFPARYILPRAQHRVSEGGFAWFEWPDQVGGERAHRRSILHARRALLQVIARARREGAGRVVILGHSMGARMAGDVALASTPALDGVALLSGVTLPSWDVTHIPHQHVFMAHGRRDGVFPFHVAEEVRDYLREHGADVTFFAFDGGHELGPILDPLVEFLRATAAVE